MTQFSVSQVDRFALKGKVAIVTGANTGIGKASALELARLGAHVIMACRSEDRARPAVESIRAELAKTEPPTEGAVEFMALDLGSIESIDAFCSAFEARKLPIHILLNNAGVMAIPKLEKTKDGIEMQFGINHVGHFALTMRLLPIIEQSAPARIVNVSSNAHKAAAVKNEFPLDDTIETKYGFFRNYAHSKLANILFTRELSDRLSARDIRNIYVNSVHPGVVRTELTRHVPSFVRFFINRFTITSEEGALTSLYACVSPEIVNKDLRGRYFEPYGVEKKTMKLANDKHLAEQLWTFTEKLIHEKRAALTTKTPAMEANSVPVAAEHMQTLPDGVPAAVHGEVPAANS